MGITRIAKSRLAVLALVSATVALGIGATSATSANGAPPGVPPAHAKAEPKWFTSWAQSQQGLATSTLNDQSARVITHLSQGGDALRIRLQNQFGTSALTVDAVSIALSAGGAATVKGTERTMKFAGRSGVMIPAGGEVWSDSVRLTTQPQDNVAVSIYTKGPTTPGQHGSALRDNYVTPAGSGNHVADTSGTAYTQAVTSTYFVSAVDVHNPKLIGTIVPFGSSVVDGTGSTNCGPGCTETGNYRRWADDLARRVVDELPASQQLGVANAGIGGTTSSNLCPDEPDSAKGNDAMARLDRDVLALHGVTAVIYYYGTNDLQDNCTADPILASYSDVFQRLHDAGIKVYVTPITPRPGYTDQMNLDRYTVNTFVMNRNSCSDTCDGVVDFDQVLKDALQPNIINPDYDNGDGIHANIAGQQAIADYISLPLLVSSASANGKQRR